MIVVEGKNLHMEKHYEGSNILFLESGVLSKSLQICIAFLSFMVNLTFAKISEYLGKSHNR